MTLYEVLEVAVDATQEEIKAAYRSKARQYHPDRCKDPDATKKFQEILAAYEVLRDYAKRNAYDETGKSEAPQYQAFAEGFLIQQAMVWINNPVNDNSYSDLISFLTTMLNQQLEQARKAVLEGDDIKARLARAMGKLNHTSSTRRDFLRLAIEERMEKVEEQQEHARNAIGGFAYARELLSDYDYDRVLAIAGARPAVMQLWATSTTNTI